MTEYDYSPEAYERYIAKLSSVARWVDDQSQAAARYGNPFVPSANGSAYYRSSDDSRSGSPNNHHRRHNEHERGRERVRDREREHDRDRDRLNSRQSTSTRPQPVFDQGAAGGRSSSRHHRSRTAAAIATVYPQHAYNNHASYSSASLNIYNQAHQNPRPTARHSQPAVYQQQLYQSRSRPAHAHSRSYAYATNAAYSSSQLHLHNAHTQPYAQDAVRVSDLSRAGYKAAPGQPVVMQSGRDTYVVYPGHNRAIEVRVCYITFSCIRSLSLPQILVS